MSFSATEAAFEGFRVVRRKPAVVLFWGAMYLLMFALMFGIGAPSFARVMALAETIERSSEPSLSDLQQLGMIYMGMIGWLAPLGLVIGAVLNAAVARSVLRPEQGAWGYLRLGRDELRVLVVNLVLGLLFGLAGGIGFVAVGAFFAGGQPIFYLLGLLAALAVIAGLIWLGVKLSLAVPITVDRGRIALFDSFAATRGRFWPLLGMAIIVLIMTWVVSLLGYIIFMPISLMTGGGLEGLAVYDGLDLPALLTRAWPALAAWSVVNAVLSALQLAVLIAPFSAAWKDLRA